MTTVIEQADEYLEAIGRIKRDMDDLTRRMEAEMVVVRGQYQDSIKAHAALLAAHEARLEALVTANQKQILGDSDRADLIHGAVLLKVQQRVKRIRTMLARLKKAKILDAVKIVESVDWDEVDKFDDATLKRLGTKRVPRKHFSYELK